MKIRRGIEKDISGIMKLLDQVQNVHAYGREDLFKINGRKYSEGELRVILCDEARPVYVGVNEKDEVLGYVFCVFEETDPESTSLQHFRTLYIDDLCVDETIRGEGIGKQLFEFAKEIAREKECYRVTLHVWECNPTATKFYDAMGMKPLNTTMESIL